MECHLAQWCFLNKLIKVNFILRKVVLSNLDTIICETHSALGNHVAAGGRFGEEDVAELLFRVRGGVHLIAHQVIGLNGREKNGLVGRIKGGLVAVITTMALKVDANFG